MSCLTIFGDFSGVWGECVARCAACQSSSHLQKHILTLWRWRLATGYSHCPNCCMKSKISVCKDTSSATSLFIWKAVWWVEVCAQWKSLFWFEAVSYMNFLVYLTSGAYISRSRSISRSRYISITNTGWSCSIMDPQFSFLYTLIYILFKVRRWQISKIGCRASAC